MSEFIEMYSTYFILPCTLVIFLIGYYLGRSKVKHERQLVMKALMKVIESTDELSQDVGCHNAELKGMGESVEELDLSTEMGQMQHMLLEHINSVIVSNRQLEDDLTCARYKLDTQAQELDRTRVEARTDKLSQLNNRKAFDETFEYWVARYHRKRKRFALLLVDVDHFKWINDTHGHQAGDVVVSCVGALLKKCVRSSDFVARYGGDEFAILLNGVDQAKALEIAERTRNTAASQNFSAKNGETIAITFSIGIAITREGDTAESLLARADGGLYKAKEAGRNCVRSNIDNSPQDTIAVSTAN